MPLTLPFCSNLAEALPSGAKTLRLQEAITDLCAALAAPAHAFATVYTLSFSEVILVSGCGTGADAGKLTITRGASGTSARSWPANTCFKITEIIPGAVCPDAGDDADTDPCGPFDPVASIPVGSGLCWDLTTPGNPKLGLCPTGVVPTNAACGEVNQFGQLVSIPANWPASCLTPFDPCCDDGGAGAMNACDVTYATGSGSGVITGSTVCAALDQLADAIGGAGGGSGVSAVSAGTGIDVTGSASAPVVSIEPSGIVAGVYSGFNIDATGRVTGYAAPPGGGTVNAVVGTSPVVATPSGTTVTVSVLPASTSQFGVVQLADPGDAGTAATSANEDHVVTREFLEAWATARGIP